MMSKIKGTIEISKDFTVSNEKFPKQPSERTKCYHNSSRFPSERNLKSKLNSNQSNFCCTEKLPVNHTQFNRPASEHNKKQFKTKIKLKET